MKKKHSAIEIETDRLLCQWAKWYRHRPEGGYAAAPLDGNLALLETRNYRNRPQVTAQGKETRQQRSKILINDDAEMMEKILGLVGVRDHKAVKSLTMYYLYNNHRITADQMNISTTYARQLKNRGFSMVVKEMSNNP